MNNLGSLERGVSCLSGIWYFLIPFLESFLDGILCVSAAVFLLETRRKMGTLTNEKLPAFSYMRLSHLFLLRLS